MLQEERMATPEEVAETALALARRFLDSQRERLGALATEEVATLRRAQELIHAANRHAPEHTRTREHIAFALLTAAYWQRYPTL
jgi:hypothetical protein